MTRLEGSVGQHRVAQRVGRSMHDQTMTANLKKALSSNIMSYAPTHSTHSYRTSSVKFGSALKSLTNLAQPSPSPSSARTIRAVFPSYQSHRGLKKIIIQWQQMKPTRLIKIRLRRDIFCMETIEGDQQITLSHKGL